MIEYIAFANGWFILINLFFNLIKNVWGGDSFNGEQNLERKCYRLLFKYNLQ